MEKLLQLTESTRILIVRFSFLGYLMVKRILVVEDSKILRQIIIQIIKDKLGFEVDSASSFGEAKKLLEHPEHYLLALLDITLPDAPDGEVVDYTIKVGLPAMVLTGNLSKELRKKMVRKNIIDYVTKERSEDIVYITNRVAQIAKNHKRKILVVEDSIVSRNLMVSLLKIQLYTVFEAENGIEALKVLEQEPDIKIILTDFTMPEMNGLDLTIAVRKKYSRDKMAIIAVSSNENPEVASHLLKLGATDFIYKPFIKEEFDCRVNNTVEALENIETVFNLATKDYLTGLYNRRHFFQMAEIFFKKVRKDHSKFAIGMFDLDNFKSINDTYGHAAGDQILQEFAEILKRNSSGEDIVARFGGEEFCFVLNGHTEEDAFEIFDAIRIDVLNSRVITTSGETIDFTTSVGMTCNLEKDISTMINHADKLLYRAKDEGKNRVIGSFN